MTIPSPPIARGDLSPQPLTYLVPEVMASLRLVDLPFILGTVTTKEEGGEGFGGRGDG